MAEKSISFFQGIKHVPNLDQLDQEKQPMKTDEKPVIEENSDNEKISLSDFCTYLRLDGRTSLSDKNHTF